MINLLVFIHVFSIVGLAMYGLLGFFTLWLYLRHRHTAHNLPDIDAASLPAVTVQIPIYNEREVVTRCITAACNLDYPRDRLQIQILDDSTDDTTQIAAELVQSFRSQGMDVSIHHRTNRNGFKAGALAAGLADATGEYIAIFDADFQPLSDFLLKTMPYFLVNEQIGLVQTRWGHLNEGESALTGAQTIAIDKHFVIEQTVRFRADFFPKFNGAAGIWRRSCLEEVGGWQNDTVCEDLCLSTRAILGGWKADFAFDIVAPAELPNTILGYKKQQSRWAMGSMQCLKKYGKAILLASNQPLIGRLYALLSMSAYLTHALLLLLLLVQLPLLVQNYRLPEWLVLFSLFGLGQPILFLLAQQVLYRDWQRRLLYFPVLLLAAIGMAPSNTHAAIQALAGTEFTFARTPKGPNKSYSLRPDFILVIEISLAVYSGLALLLALSQGRYGSIPLLLSCLLGFSYIIILTFLEQKQANHQTTKI